MFLLPLVGAVLWGLWYVLAEEGLQSVSIPTWLFISAVGTFTIALGLHFFGPEQVDLKPIFASKRTFLILLACIAVAELASVAIAVSLKELPASYVAIVEVCYPIFVPIFAYMILKQNQFDMSTLMGGALILCGVLCIAMFQTQEEGGVQMAEASNNTVVAFPIHKVSTQKTYRYAWPQNFTLTYVQKYIVEPTYQYIQNPVNQNLYFR